MESVAAVEVTEDSKKEKTGKNYNDETHPYMTPQFWLDPKNQFWNRSSMFKKESYEHILDNCRAEVARKHKEDLIIWK